MQQPTAEKTTDQDLETYKDAFAIFLDAKKQLVNATADLDELLANKPSVSAEPVSIEITRLREQIQSIVDAVQDEFEAKLRRDNGNRAVSDKARLAFFERNKSRIDNEVNSRISRLKSDMQVTDNDLDSKQNKLPLKIAE